MEAAGLAVGVISLAFTVFQGCVNGLKLLSTAQHFGQDADMIRCLLDIENYRLLEWAEEAGLIGQGPPDPTLQWPLIHDILQQLSRLVNDAAVLRKTYNLEITELLPTDVSAGVVADAAGALHLSSLTQSLARSKSKAMKTKSTALRSEPHLFKRLRWAMVDKDNIRRLTDDIQHFVVRLLGFLDTANRRGVKAMYESLLRHAISASETPDTVRTLEEVSRRSVTADDPDEIRRLARVCEVKLKVMAVDVDSSPLNGAAGQAANAPGASQQRHIVPRGRTAGAALKKKSMLLYRNNGRQLAADREMATYDSQLVIVEWKTVEKAMEARLKYRVEGLAVLLHAPKPPSFHALHCLGFVQDRGKFGFLFTVPSAQGGTSNPTACNPQDLHSLFQESSLRPGLSSRVTLAVSLVETVLELHTAGWLHKAICSQNVLFFLKDEVGRLTPDAEGPFLVGYEFARFDNPLEVSDKPPPDPESDIYRHPLATADIPRPFHKTFDLYALGLVLLEIGTWTALASLLLEAAGVTIEQNDGSRNLAKVNARKQDYLDGDQKGMIMDRLRFSVFETYVECVESLLKGVDVDEEEPGEDPLTLLEHVLQKLQTCQV
ncbi:MAG: hypothetical protein M1817_001185 [Caeruleum heppii]|nr:MAG: hypothetical protein M1817_001185 [Caeruleum heppii]